MSLTTTHPSSDAAPEGACPSCGVGVGHYSRYAEVVTCRGCGLPWPSDYWREQAGGDEA